MVNVRTLLRYALVAVLGLVVLLAIVLALPIDEWRTGRSETEPLELAAEGAHAVAGRRVWIDTDAACGASRITDPDDCLALLALLKAPGLRVVGVSTVFGNAPLDVTDRTTRELVARLSSDGIPVPPVYRGRRAATDEHQAGPTPAEIALRHALAEAPTVIIALGPLTNLAGVLRGRPALLPRIRHIVAVMGQRPGHVFHPVEGGTARMLFGHGPVFQDFNFVQDAAAAAEIVSLGIPLTLVPYDAARWIRFTDADLDAVSRAGASGSWVAKRSRDWLAFWREDIGQEGFFPFDLVAVGFLLHPELFRCAVVDIRVGRHPGLWQWVLGDTGLLVDPARTQNAPSSTAMYCPGLSDRLLDELVSDLARLGQASDAR